MKHQLYSVSVVGAVTAIVLMRWGVWAVIHMALRGGCVCLLQKLKHSQK